MAEDVVEKLARDYLMSGKDIASGIRGLESWLSAKGQMSTYSPENIEATRNSGLIATSRNKGGIGPVAGVSRWDANRPIADFADQYLNNLPFLLRRDDQGNPVYTEDSVRRAVSLETQGPVDGLSKEAVTRMQLLAGEMLALSQKAAEGLASPEELKLLDVYQQFMASRTGM